MPRGRRSACARGIGTGAAWARGAAAGSVPTARPAPVAWPLRHLQHGRQEVMRIVFRLPHSVRAFKLSRCKINCLYCVIIIYTSLPDCAIAIQAKFENDAHFRLTFCSYGNGILSRDE